MRIIKTPVRSPRANGWSASTGDLCRPCPHCRGQPDHRLGRPVAAGRAQAVPHCVLRPRPGTFCSAPACQQPCCGPGRSF